jgi:hypothetical protein
MNKLKILTFNHHESYLCSLAETGHDFDVVVKYKNLDLSWSKNQRPCPANFRMVTFDDIRDQLRGRNYDVIICHTLKNLLWLFFCSGQSYIFVAHIPLFKHTFALRIKSLLKKLAYTAFKMSHRVAFFAVSMFKLESWNERGFVAVLSPQKLPPLIANTGFEKIIFVCNDLATRREELGYSYLESIAAELPLQVIGNNPGITYAVKPKDFEEFTNLFRSARIFLYTIKQPYGDGYNTAMLEAMSLGMAIVTIHNPSSPIIHNVNGLVANNTAELKAYLRKLLGDRNLVTKLGDAAQKTVAEKFSKDAFLKAWNEVLSCK